MFLLMKIIRVDNTVVAVLIHATARHLYNATTRGTLVAPATHRNTLQQIRNTVVAVLIHAAARTGQGCSLMQCVSMTVAWLSETERTWNSMHDVFRYKIDPSYMVCWRLLSIIFRIYLPPARPLPFRWTGIFRKGRVVPLFLNCCFYKKANVCSKLAPLRASTHATCTTQGLEAL